jgi:AraC-like DNA-binding protein
MAENPQVSLEEVAVNSGFNSTSTFRRVFTKKHGVTPSVYRQSISKRP